MAIQEEHKDSGDSSGSNALPAPNAKDTSCFRLPAVVDNPHGWGPSVIPSFLTQIPYAPFSKSDRVGKIADWNVAAPSDGATGTSGSTGTTGAAAGGTGFGIGAGVGAGAGSSSSSRASASGGSYSTGDGLGADNLPYRNPRRNMRMAPEAFGTGTASAFAFALTPDDEASFSVVDRATKLTLGGGIGGSSGGGGTSSFRSFRGGFGGRGGFRGGFGSSGGRGGYSGGGSGGAGGGNQQGGMASNDKSNRVGGGGFGRDSRGGGGFANRRRYGGYNDRPQRIRDSSVQVGPEWKIMEEIDFVRLNKLFYEVDDPEDISAFGSAAFYDKSYDRVTTKFDKTLQTFDRTFVNVTASADPILQNLSKDMTGPCVFATDNVLSTLMCTARSVYSWDIIITKCENKIFIDKRDGGNFDFVTVNENAAEPPLEADKDGINTPIALAQESTLILHNYSQQVVKDAEPRFALDGPHPFAEYASDAEPLPSGILRYRKWDLGDGISLCVRTVLDAVLPGGSSGGAAGQAAESEVLSEATCPCPLSDVLFVNIKALNEFDSRAPGAGGAPEWRQKLDSQRGAVMATEIKNNGNKLARWTTEALLSGADQLRIGFVSRATPKDKNKHTVLGNVQFKPKEFAGQMNLNLGNGWGIIKTFVDLVLKYDDGKYVMVKDPNKAMVRLYSVPATALIEIE